MIEKTINIKSKIHNKTSFNILSFAMNHNKITAVRKAKGTTAFIRLFFMFSNPLDNLITFISPNNLFKLCHPLTDRFICVDVLFVYLFYIITFKISFNI